MKPSAPQESLEQWISESLERLETLEQQRDQMSVAFQHARTRCDRLATATRDWDGRTEILHKMQHDLEAELAHANESVTKAEQALAEARRARDELMQARDEASQRIATVERDRHDLDTSLAAAEKTRDALQITLDGMNQEIAGLYSTLESVANDADAGAPEAVPTTDVVSAPSTQASEEAQVEAHQSSVVVHGVASEGSNGSIQGQPTPLSESSVSANPTSASISGEIVARGMWAGTVQNHQPKAHPVVEIPLAPSAAEEALAAAQARAAAAQAAAVAQAAAIAQAAAAARSASEAVAAVTAEVKRADTQRIVLSAPHAAWNTGAPINNGAGDKSPSDSVIADEASEVKAKAAAIRAQPRTMRASELAARLGLKTRASAKTRPIPARGDVQKQTQPDESAGAQAQLPPPPAVGGNPVSTSSTPW